MANTPAYDTTTITAAKNFIAQAPDNLFLKTLDACNGKKLLPSIIGGATEKILKFILKSIYIKTKKNYKNIFLNCRNLKP